ncbi:MAG: RHS repeat domain-containing protein [Parachlamydiaceae bacterium]
MCLICKFLNLINYIFNPWRFANRREVVDLTLFTHRFYNNRLMRWQTTDPLGFVDSLNLYCYVHNNPFCYKDPDGRFVVEMTIIEVAFGEALIAAFLPYAVPAIAAAAVTYGAYQLADYVGTQINEQRMLKEDLDRAEEEKKKKLVIFMLPIGHYHAINMESQFLMQMRLIPSLVKSREDEGNILKRENLMTMEGLSEI